MTDETVRDTARTFDTFDGAIRAAGLPVENHAMMRRIVEYIPIARYELRKDGSVRGIRRDGGHELKFVSGYATGFASKEEGEAASGTICHPNSKTGVNWLVWLPLNSAGGGRTTQGTREQQACPSCGNLMPATNVCDFCG